MRYSQNNEEEIIREYFGDQVGTFLDLGANDGRTLSNTAACANRGWSGLMVEASPTVFELLHSRYKGNLRVYCINVAVGTSCRRITLHESGEHLGVGDRSLLSTVVASERDRWTRETFEEVEVDCVDFATLMKTTTMRRFDLISIDIEGMDLPVLRQMDLDELACRMLIVEFNGKDQHLFDAEAHKYGMHLHSKNAENLIYVR